MREYAKKPESPSRTPDTNPKASRQAPIDVILQRYKEQNIQKYAEDEELIQGKFDIAQREEIDEYELLQGKFESVTIGEQETIQREEKPNNTGLPDDLKTGIENLSGFSMDDVKVHYNSEKPAQLNALAYAQGADIHVAPGQEKHLPHEVWHIIQQKQGRVQPTMQLQGVNVNDNKALEKEADFVGNKAIQLKPSWVIQKSDDEKIDKLAYKLYEQRKEEGERENPFEDHVEAKRMLYGGLHGAKIGDRVRQKGPIIIYKVAQTNSDNIKLEKEGRPPITVNYDTKNYELLGHKNITPSERAERLGKPLKETTSEKFKRWGLSDQEISAMQIYTTSNYILVNRFLRADKDPIDEDKKAIIDWLSRHCPSTLSHYNEFMEIDQPSIDSDWLVAKTLYTEFIDTVKSAIQKFPIPKQEIVRRGVNLDTIPASSFKAQHNIGETIVDKGFLSTSYQIPFAADSIIVIKNLPKDHSGRVIDENSTYSSETEMLFPPLTGYTIEKILDDESSPEFKQEMDLINPQKEDRFKKVKRIYLCKLAMPT